MLRHFIAFSGGLYLLVFATVVFSSVFSQTSIITCGTNRSISSCSPNPDVTIHVEPLFKNPYHALYQAVWPLTYFLLLLFNETQHSPGDSTLVIPGTAIDFEGCVSRKRMRNSFDVPWQTCMALLMARKMGIGRVIRANDTERKKGDVVYRTQRRFTDLEHLPAYDELARLNFTIRFDNAIRAQALHILRDAAIEQLRLEAPVVKNFVHVVVYDRLDASGRVWENSLDAVTLLEGDSNIHVTFVREFPFSFSAQVRLARSADVFVGPHGAAFANTIFMKEGSAILEIWKCCGQNLTGTEHMARAWTGWHASVIGVGLRYIGCNDKHGTKAKQKNSFGCSNDEPMGSLRKFVASPEGVKKEVTLRVHEFLTNRSPAHGSRVLFSIPVRNDHHVEKWASTAAAVGLITAVILMLLLGVRCLSGKLWSTEKKLLGSLR